MLWEVLYKEKSSKSKPRWKWWYSGGALVGMVGGAEGREPNPGGNGVFAVGGKENPGGKWFPGGKGG